MYLNKALVLGNITRDPEMRSLPSGVKVCNFSVATNRTWKDSDGNKKEATEFHNIVVFGRQAETTSQYMSKGNTVLIEGRLQTRSWEGQDGAKKYRTEIVADRVQFGPRSGDGGSSGGGGGQAPQQNSGGADQTQQDNSGGDTVEYPDEEIDPEDIPF